jgi:uncharacterized membrane protein YfcA
VSWVDLLALVLAGAAAGLINTVVGSGTLITFPTLLALGVPPVLANVSNTIGLAPGSLSGALSMRRELTGQRRRSVVLGAASLIGGVAGALLLLRLPSSAFDAIVPVLIGLGCLLVILQPTLSRRLAARRTRLAEAGTAPVVADPAGMAVPGTGAKVALWVAILLTGVYGGYFGAAQGVLLLGVMGIALTESLPRINAVKNILALIVNGIAGVIFVIVSHVNWPAAIAIAVGSIVGAQIGGRVGRKIPPLVYRVIIVVVGIVAIVNLLVRG